MHQNINQLQSVKCIDKCSRGYCDGRTSDSCPTFVNINRLKENRDQFQPIESEQVESKSTVVTQGTADAGI